jgi:hypothetical protein
MCGPRAARVRHSGETIMLFAHQRHFFAATSLTVQEGWTVVLEPGNFKRIIARIAPATGKRSAGGVNARENFPRCRV